ncbi:MAG: polysaccharide deacetylase family protein [Bacteroides sp.]|nr:polysaccharide deacetylase family protein [Bacteroides sp.]
MKSFTYLLAAGMLCAACGGQKAATPEADEPQKEAKLVCLSFDDGPNTTTTVAMLDMLKKHDVVGSFFVIGNNINEASAEVMKRTYEMGCDIQNHSKTHTQMPTLTADEIKAEIAYTSGKIKETIGVEPIFFRPPYIAVNDVMHLNIDLCFICGHGCEDWVPEVTAEQRAQTILKAPKHGDIFLLHDMPGNDATVQALDIIIPELKKQGFEFVTVTELFKRCNVTPQPGVMYSNVFDK